MTLNDPPTVWTSPVLINLITGLVTIFTLVWNSRRQTKAQTAVTSAAAEAAGSATDARVLSEDNSRKLDQNSEKLEVVHQLVNGERHGMMDRIAQLEAAISDCDECKAKLRH